MSTSPDRLAEALADVIKDCIREVLPQALEGLTTLKGGKVSSDQYDRWRTVKETARLRRISERTVKKHISYPDCPVDRSQVPILIDYPKYEQWVNDGGADRKRLHKRNAQKAVQEAAAQ